MEHSQSLAVHSLTQRPAKRDRTEAVTELETAVARFQARLGDDERTRLQRLKSTPHDIQAVIVFTAELDRADPNRRGKSIATRLSSFLQTIQQFFPAIDVFVSSNPELAALIWGSVKLTFLILTNFTSYFESFVELLHGFSSLYSRFSEYQLLYETYTELRDSICRFNTAVVACCEQIVVVASRRMMKQVAKALTTSFQSEMRQYIDAIKAKAEDVQRDIELVKAKADRYEQKLQTKERADAAESRGLVVASLSKHWNQLTKVRRDVRKATTGRKQRRALDALSTYNRYITNLNTARNKRHLLTAHWIFDTQEFKDWYALKEVPVLHVTGKIGSGKTILTSRIIEYINDKEEQSDVISFFLCRFDDSASLDCDTILRSLIYQLASRPSLTKIIESTDLYDDLEMAEDQKYSHDSLKKLFRRSLGLVGTWFIILDGIDECTVEQRRWLFEFLSDLVTQEDTTGKVKLLLSCRETLNHEIKTWFSAPPQVVTGSSQTSQDILTYAEDILNEKLLKNELILEDANLAGEILKSISLKEQGMYEIFPFVNAYEVFSNQKEFRFLWAFLSIEDICSRKSDRDIAQALETLPSELNVTLDRALERISRHNNQEIAQNIFRWTAVVRQPLKVDQLREALSTEIGTKTIDPRSRINGMEKLTSWCENLVHIDEEDDTVCFCHHSIHQYLSQPDSGPWKDFHIDYQQSDHHVGQVCLTYLNLKSPSTALKHTRDERSRDPLQLPSTTFPITAIAQQAIRQASIGGVGVSTGKLVNRAIQLRDKSQSSRFSTSRALVDIEFPLTSHFPFLQYAEKYWHAHIRSLTSQSRSYTLLVGMLEGDLLAHKMPWMDKAWRNSVAKEIASQYDIDLEGVPSLYAIIYAHTIGSHDLLCQAVTVAEQRNDLLDRLTTRWLQFLVEEGHLDCPRSCVAEAQRHVRHHSVISCITQYIADGIEDWPALITSPGKTCDCTEYSKRGGIHEDLVQILPRGYRKSSDPLLQIFAGASLGWHTKQEFVLLCQELNLKEVDFLRARTITGKSILDLQAELPEPLKPDYNPHKPPRLLLDILERENVMEHAQKIGFGFDELQLLLRNGLLWSYRNTNEEVGEPLTKIIQNLALSEPDRIAYNISIFDVAEQVIKEKTTKQLMEFVAKESVKFYFESASRLARFPEESFSASFEQAVKATNWILAKVLAKRMTDAYLDLAKTLTSPVAREFCLILGCRRCKVKEDYSMENTNWRLTLCQLHREKYMKLTNVDVNQGKDGEDDECLGLLRQLATEGSLASCLTY